jgi:hypothetical protein
VKQKWPNLKLNTQLKQLLGSLPLALVLPGAVFPDAAVLKDTVKWQIRINQILKNQLPVSDTNWQHGSQLCFATFI